MKKSYMVPDLEMYTVRPDEQIAQRCVFVNSADTGYDCWFAEKNPNGGYPMPGEGMFVGIFGS